MRTRAAGLGAALLVLALAGCGGSPKASSPTTTPTPVDLGSRVTVGSVMTVQPPAGWTVRRSSVADGSGDVCLAPPGGSSTTSPAIFGCAGIAIWFGKHLPGAEMSSYAPNREIGWYPATDVAECPFTKPSAAGGKFVGLLTEPGFDQGLKRVGSHQADWNRWSANCDGGGHPFHPQAWYLPRSKVVIFDYLEHPQTAEVLASARFVSDGAPVATYVSGRLVSMNETELVVKPFETYVDGPAGKAYAEAHGIEYPFMNDYYDAEEGPQRTFVLDANTTCQGNVALGKPAEGAAIGCSAFAQAPAGTPVGIWVVPGGSSAQAVIEIFRP